ARLAPLLLARRAPPGRTRPAVAAWLLSRSRAVGPPGLHPGGTARRGRHVVLSQFVVLRAVQVVRVRGFQGLVIVEHRGRGAADRATARRARPGLRGGPLRGPAAGLAYRDPLGQRAELRLPLLD